MTWIDDIKPPYGTVTGRFVQVQWDSADEDLLPDVQPLNGSVTLTPTAPAGGMNGALAEIRTVQARIFGGEIVDEDENPGIRVLATDAEVGVEDWAWEATFQLDSGLRLKPLKFKITTGETVSLTDGLIPVESMPYQVVEGKPGQDGISITGVIDEGGGIIRQTFSDGTESEPITLPTAPGVPVFPTLAEAQAWEAQNPGRTALYISDSMSESPTTPANPPVTSSAPKDYAYRWLGETATPISWTDTVAGLSLPKAGTGSIAVKDGIVTFPGPTDGAGAGYGGKPIAFTQEPTVTVVARVATSEYGYAMAAGQPIDWAVNVPNGNGYISIGNVATKDVPAKPGEWVVITARYGTPGSTQRTVTQGATTAVLADGKPVPTSLTFGINPGFQGKYWFVGDMREVRVWDRRLTDDEIYYTHEALAAQYGFAL